MLKKLHAIILIFAFLICGFNYAQEKPISKEEKLATKGDGNYDKYSFSPAIDIYKRVLDKGYVSSSLLKKLGDSYYFNANYQEAAQIYKKLVDEYPKEVSPEHYFRYSQTLKSLGDYEMSNSVMDKFIEVTSEDVRANRFKNERNYIEEIEKNSGRYKIKPFEYNTMFSEFAPSFYKEGLIFSSDRDTGNFARYRHTWNAKDFLDLYKVNADSVSFSKVIKFNENVNTRWHESTSVTTKDGETMYFTRNNIRDGKYVRDEKGVVRLKLFKAKLIDGEWDRVVELPFNSDNYSTAHPVLSPDEKTLYFASDMPGTRGESDIFKVEVKEFGEYGNPVNLGDVINTEARETFPFVSKDSVLYFSSDGHPGLGGLDIFAVKLRKSNRNQHIQNIGRPVNSNMDDFTFIFNSDTKEGYFASNRERGSGADDIYRFIEEEPLKLECLQKITGTVRDKISNEVLVGATVKVIDIDNNEILTVITDNNGDYSLTLDCNQGNFVRAVVEGYIPFEEYIGKSDGKPKIIDFYLERDKVTAGYGDDLAKLLQLSTIYFDFDKYDIRSDSKIEVEKVIAAMEKYPSLKIKVNSHTDSRGKDSYNLWLSQKRAEATTAYMVSKGISADRLEEQGYGETKLINSCANGVRCKGKDHELNRRSEFIILK